MTAKKLKISAAQNNKENIWACLLPDLLEQISDRLPVVDLLKFRAVCRSWRRAPSGRAPITKFSRETPWLIVYDYNGGGDGCTLFHPSHPQCCTLPVPSLTGATCIRSKFGWLLARRNNGCLLLCNPLMLSTISLPKHPTAANVRPQTCTFLYLPTSQDCTVFVVAAKNSSALEISSCRPQTESEWSSEVISCDAALLGAVQSVRCCTCEDSRRCDCGHKNKIYAYGSNDNYCLAYDFVEKKHRMVKYGFTGSSSALVETVKFHHKELRKRFSKEGSSWCLSTSILETSSDSTSSGPYNCNFRPRGERQGKARDRMVKAAWVEPRFWDTKSSSSSMEHA